MSTLTHTFTRHGRVNYQFHVPKEIEDPDFAISLYTDDDPLESGRDIIFHYNEALKTCADIGQALISCMERLDLEPFNTELSACINTMMENKDVTIEIIQPEADQEPPQIATYAKHPVPQRIDAACQSLNHALQLSFKYKNDEQRHRQTRENLREVRRYRVKGQYMKESFLKLERMVSFIDNLKTQTEYFIDDFLHAK